MRVELQPAYIIHRRSYRNTSWLLEAFSSDYGLIALVAKGVRRHHHPWKHLLEPFVHLHLSFSGRGELMTLSGLEPAGFHARFSGDKIYAGLYLNELLRNLLHRNDSHEALFMAYQRALSELDQAVENIEPALRRFELSLLRETGYGLQLEGDIEVGKNYYYDVERGPVVGEYEKQKPIVSGGCLLALARNDFSDLSMLAEMKKLLRHVLHHHMSGKPLKSRELFSAKKTRI